MAAPAHFGDQGTAFVIAPTGMMDADAGVRTLSGMPTSATESGLAGLALAGAILANTAVKAVLTLVIGGGRLGILAALPLLRAMLASIDSILLYPLL